LKRERITQHGVGKARSQGTANQQLGEHIHCISRGVGWINDLRDDNVITIPDSAEKAMKK
jgi:hypothetical protein